MMGWRWHETHVGGLRCDGVRSRFFIRGMIAGGVALIAALTGPLSPCGALAQDDGPFADAGVLAAAVESEPQRPSIGGGAPDRLTIASWDLRDAEDAGVVKQPRAVKRTWRHTFGSERRANAAASNTRGDIDADVVLLQGVRSAKIARKLFPARDWRLILSRQLLDLTGFDNRFGQPLPDGKSITAIAVRYSRYIRVTGHEHFMSMAAPMRENVLPEPVLTDANPEPVGRSASNADDVSGSPVLRTIAQRDETQVAGEPGVAGVGVRILHAQDVIWVVSADFGEDCQPRDDTCARRAVLDQWTGEQRANGFMVVRGEKSGREDAPEPPAVSEPIVAKPKVEEKPARSAGLFSWLQAGPDRAAKPAKEGRKAETTAASEDVGKSERIARNCSGQSLIPDPKLAGDLKVIADKGCLAVLSLAR